MINYSGGICGRKADESPYFWFYDPLKRVDGTFHMCQDHSNNVINQLIEKEVGYSRLIDRLYKNIENIRNTMNNGKSLSEQREAIRQAKENGVPPPKFKTMEQMKREISELYEKAKRFKEIKNIERNKTCRFCGFPLKEPELQTDQIGNKFAHADFHSPVGYRREVILFHTECSMAWIANTIKLEEKYLRYVQPRRVGQHKLLQFI